MMTTLLESKPRKQKAAGGTIFSVVFHSAIIFFAVYATARAGIEKDNQKREQNVNFVKIKEPPPPPEIKKKEPPPPPPKVKKPPPRTEHTPQPLPPVPKQEIAPPKGFQVLKAPVNIPVELPKVDLSAKVTNEADFSGKGVAGGTASGKEGGTGDNEAGKAGIDPDKAYMDFQVEEQVSAISGTQVDYPESMRSSGLEGQVDTQFVVDENGRIQSGSFKVLNSANAAFVDAVKRAIPSMRFKPAKIGNTKVSQVVQQSFKFKLSS
ncbi:MAG: TonB family protein [Gemmatimonadota bacterium]|nr:TonB family protein [Gemmatimonadota bacterium]